MHKACATFGVSALVASRRTVALSRKNLKSEGDRASSGESSLKRATEYAAGTATPSVEGCLVILERTNEGSRLHDAFRAAFSLITQSGSAN